MFVDGLGLKTPLPLFFSEGLEIALEMFAVTFDGKTLVVCLAVLNVDEF